MTKNREYETLIIGGGIIGTMIHYYLLENGFKNIVQLEKNSYLADETSSGNSGVLHGGFDAEHPIEAKLNLLGTNMWKKEILNKFTKIPRVNIPSLIVAFNDDEMKHVNALYARGIKNKLNPNDIKIISKDNLHKLEPNLNKNAMGGLLCTSSVAIDPVIATQEIARECNKNSEVLTSAMVTNIKRRKDGKFIVTINGYHIIIVGYVINSAGHYSGIISKMANEGNPNLVTKRGEYRVLSKDETKKINNIVFKVPTIHGKGVIVAPMLDGRVLIGPTAEDNVPIADTRLVTPEKYDLIGEIGSYLIPNLDLTKTEKTFSGSRSIDVETNDFHINYGNNRNWINLHGIKSPGLSSAPSIALEVIELIKNYKLK